MKDLGQPLRDADPLAREGRMSSDEVSRMWRAVVDAARDAPADIPAWWPRPMLVAATVVVTLAAGVAAGRWLPLQSSAIDRAGATVAASASAPPSRERRQLQFASPGGTRIIWVFDSDFNP
jgi:hypothetical protein